MTRLRKPGAGLLLGGIFTVVLSACDNGAESTASGAVSEHPETQREQVSRTLRETRAALAAAEQSNRTLSAGLQQRQQQLDDADRSIAELQRINGELRRQADQVWAELDRSRAYQAGYRRQLARATQRSRDLIRERDGLRAALTKAQGEVRRIQIQRGTREQALADLRYRLALTSQEAQQLRSYNASLLQELGDLQTWLQEADATQRIQRDKLRQAELEAEQARGSRVTEDAHLQALRAELAKANEEITMLRADEAASAEEIRGLRMKLTDTAASEQRQREQLQRARQHAGTLADAHDHMAGALALAKTALRRERESQQTSRAEAARLLAALDQATYQAARLKSAKDYLVEKVEAYDAELTMARASDRERVEELRSAIAKIRALESERDTAEQEHDSLARKLESVETECAAAKEKVATLTWANEVPVKELDAAYETPGKAKPLPDGTRALYTVQKGEDLSTIAQTFYGDRERWKDLLEANRARIRNPDEVEPGTVVRIPK